MSYPAPPPEPPSELVQQVASIIIPAVEKYVNDRFETVEKTLRTILEVLNRHESLITNLSGRLSQLESSSTLMLIENTIRASMKVTLETVTGQALSTMTRMIMDTITKIVDAKISEIMNKLVEMVNEMNGRVSQVSSEVARFIGMTEQMIEKLVSLSRDISRLYDMVEKLSTELSNVSNSLNKLISELRKISEELEKEEQE